MVPRSSGRGTSILAGALSVVRRLTVGATPLRLELIQAASRAPRLLGESSALVRKFVLSKQNEDGSFQDRTGRSDLYYTVFGLELMRALDVPMTREPLRSHLASFEDGESLDFVHLCCLARCRALLGDIHPEKTSLNERLVHRIEYYRTDDGGYHPACGSAHGTAYAAFLALGAYQDLQTKLPNLAGLRNALQQLATPDGGWANELPAKLASTNSTAAAVGVLGHIGAGSEILKAGQWLRAQAHPLGGFRASTFAPVPDLLSTATALHTLASMGISIAPFREPCLNFIDTLWSNDGGFHGHWEDDILDIEYTFYGLLALGHLAK